MWLSRAACLAMVVATVTIIYLLMTSQRERVSRRNFEKLNTDMTIEQILDILGQPDALDKNTIRGVHFYSWYTWHEDKTGIRVVYDAYHQDGRQLVLNITAFGRLPLHGRRPPAVPFEREMPSWLRHLKEHQDKQREQQENEPKREMTPEELINSVF